MGLFDHFPYTNVHELNLDWVLSMMKALEAEWEAFTAGNSLTFADPLQHDMSMTYAKNTIVIDGSGNAYVSLQAVPVGVALGNQDYWLMVFDYEAFIEKVNKNFTARYYRGQYRATAAMAVGDWLTVDDVLCKATAAIAADDVLEVGVNIEHFTLEDFIKAFMQSATQLIQQYKNDIDASELLYRQQLAGDIAATTASLQAQLDAVIAGATVDSEVIAARVGWNGITYANLGDAIRTQVSDLQNEVETTAWPQTFISYKDRFIRMATSEVEPYGAGDYDLCDPIPLPTDNDSIVVSVLKVNTIISKVTFLSTNVLTDNSSAGVIAVWSPATAGIYKLTIPAGATHVTLSTDVDSLGVGTGIIPLFLQSGRVLSKLVKSDNMIKLNQTFTNYLNRYIRYSTSVLTYLSGYRMSDPIQLPVGAKSIRVFIKYINTVISKVSFLSSLDIISGSSQNIIGVWTPSTVGMHDVTIPSGAKYVIISADMDSGGVDHGDIEAYINSFDMLESITALENTSDMVEIPQVVNRYNGYFIRYSDSTLVSYAMNDYGICDPVEILPGMSKIRVVVTNTNYIISKVSFVSSLDLNDGSSQNIIGVWTTYNAGIYDVTIPVGAKYVLISKDVDSSGYGNYPMKAYTDAAGVMPSLLPLVNVSYPFSTGAASEFLNLARRDALLATRQKLRAGSMSWTAYGDSITDTHDGHAGSPGGASDAAHGYAKIVQRWLKDLYGNGITFVNNGTGGMDSSGAVAKLDDYIIGQNYDLVTLAFGTNDWNNQTTLTAFETNMDTVISRILNETSADVVIIGLGYFDSWKPTIRRSECEYNQVLMKLAKQYNLPYVDVRAAMYDSILTGVYTFGDITLTADPVHPNDIGHTIWAGATFKTING